MRAPSPIPPTSILESRAHPPPPPSQTSFCEEFCARCRRDNLRKARAGLGSQPGRERAGKRGGAGEAARGGLAGERAAAGGFWAGGPGMAGAGPRRGRAVRAGLTAPAAAAVAAAAGAPAAAAAAAASSSSSPGDGGPILLQVAASRASGDGWVSYPRWAGSERETGRGWRLGPGPLAQEVRLAPRLSAPRRAGRARALLLLHVRVGGASPRARPARRPRGGRLRAGPPPPPRSHPGGRARLHT